MSGKQVKSEVIRPEEVLAYLNELGYTNISAQMLKEFLTDLKKLLKYYKKHNLVDSDYKTIDPLYNDQHVSSEQYEPRTEKAEVAPPTSYCGAVKGSQQISIQVKKPKKIIHKHCVHLQSDPYICGCDTATGSGKTSVSSATKESFVLKGSSITKQSSPAKEPSVTKDSASTKETSPTNGSSAVVEASASKVDSASKSDSEVKSKKKKHSVKSAKCVNRCDPVALYHHYQSEWKKVKLPGEDNHSDLRRLIRCKLRGDSQISQRSSSRTRSCRC